MKFVQHFSYVIFEQLFHSQTVVLQILFKEIAEPGEKLFQSKDTYIESALN